MARFHPDLALARFIPPVRFGPVSTALLNRVKPRSGEAPPDLLVEDLEGPGPEGAPGVLVRVYRPRTLVGPAPALLWIHGAGWCPGRR